MATKLKMSQKFSFAVFIVCLCLATSMQARIVKIDVQSTSAPAPDGYLTITGRAYGEVDPAHSLNGIIQDIKLAPLNVRKMAEYSMDFTILKPPDGGNGLLFYEVVNRGWPISRATPSTGIEPLARQRGYTVVWSGWQADVKKLNPLRHTIEVPTASEGGKEITGWVWISVEVTQPSPSAPFWATNQDFKMYEPVDLNAADSELTRQLGPDDPPITIPRTDWAFGRCDAANPFPGIPGFEQLCLRDGLEPRYAYTVRYRARNPLVMGLGLAAIRDFVSFLRNDLKDSLGTPNPIAGTIRASMMEGASQAGQIVRTFLHLGFNLDEQGRRVFDGMNPVIAGTRNALNVRFSLPTPGQAFRLGHLRPGWESPFTWMPEIDCVAPRFGWVLQRCMETASCPNIIHVVSSSEYWNSRASLTATDVLGQFDEWIPRNVRMYLLSGTQHSPAAAPPGRGICQQLMNPNDWSPYHRALLVALEQWILEYKEPPPSQVPSLAEGTLVESDAASIGWPNIPGANYTGRINALPLVDFGSAFDARDMTGILSDKPAVIPGRAYTVLVPKVDADGNETAGIRPSTVQAPVATYTGWNLQREGFAEGELCQNTGSYIPFRRSKADREAVGDPRLSLEERYGDHAGYVDAVRQAVTRLVTQRFLLPEDAKAMIEQAEKSNVP
jgi:alpha/beta hydrolase family protein